MSGKIVFLVSFFIAASSIAAFSQSDQENEYAKALAKYQVAEDFYSKGEYASAKENLDAYIRDFRSQGVYFPEKIKAKVYLLRAKVTYAFREEGYKEEIEGLFKMAIERDLDLDVGDPATVPPYLITLFSKVRESYFHSYSREVRRSTLGLFAAFVLEPNGVDNDFVLQPGICYTFAFDDNFELELDLRFPPRWPLLDSLRGQAGLTWFPYYRVENLCMGISGYYLFGLDQLKYYNHSVSFCGKGEIILRSGFGIAASVEVLRLDLLLGYSESNPPSEIRYLDLVPNVFRLGFANINLYLVYNF